jgi:hypothetical protein
MMNAYCPECETDLDDTTGICPACRWDPQSAIETSGVRVTRMVHAPEMSLTERYRGTPYDFSLLSGAIGEPRQGVSRARTLVIIGLIGAAVLYGVILTLMMGPA